MSILLNIDFGKNNIFVFESIKIELQDKNYFDLNNICYSKKWY